MTTDRMQPLRLTVLGVTALVMLLQVSSSAQSRRGTRVRRPTAAQAPVAAAHAPVASAEEIERDASEALEAMDRAALAALLDDTDAIVRGIIGQPAPVRTDAGAVRHRDYDVHSPVIVFQRTDSTLGLDPGPSWTQTVRVRLVNQAASPRAVWRRFTYPARVLTPHTESVLFLQKHADVLRVTAAFRITDERLVPQLTAATFVPAYTGMTVDEFAVTVLKDLFLGPFRSSD